MNIYFINLCNIITYNSYFRYEWTINELNFIDKKKKTKKNNGYV